MMTTERERLKQALEQESCSLSHSGGGGGGGGAGVSVAYVQTLKQTLTEVQQGLLFRRLSASFLCIFLFHFEQNAQSYLFSESMLHSLYQFSVSFRHSIILVIRCPSYISPGDFSYSYSR